MRLYERVVLRRFGQVFKKWYYRLRSAGHDPSRAFDATLARAAKEVGYSGWPLPQTWLDVATAVAVKRDGDALAESRREWGELWRQMHGDRWFWCEKDSSEEPFVEGTTFDDGLLARPVHGSCLEDMRQRGLLSGPEAP